MRLRTKEKIARDKRLEKDREKTIKIFLNKIPKNKRKEAEKLMEETSELERRKDMFGAISILALAIFFSMYAFGLYGTSILLNIFAGILIIVFIIAVVTMILNSKKAQNNKEKLRILATKKTGDVN